MSAFGGNANIVPTCEFVGLCGLSPAMQRCESAEWFIGVTTDIEQQARALNGSCVTSIAGPHGGTQLYER